MAVAHDKRKAEIKSCWCALGAAADENARPAIFAFEAALGAHPGDAHLLIKRAPKMRARRSEMAMARKSFSINATGVKEVMKR